MRANTSAIIASPEFSVTTQYGGKTARLYFPSVSSAHAYAITHARTQNERSWINSSAFLGCKGETMPDVDKAGSAKYPLECVKKAIAGMEQKPTKPGAIRNTVSGGYWDIPSVLAGLPLAARSRIRTALPPLTLHIMVDFSAEVTAEFMAPITAKIAKALNNYTLAGGAVNLSLCSIAQTRNPQYRNLVIETRVNAADVASIAFAFSPVFLRGVIYPIEAALSLQDNDPLPLVRTKPIPNAYYLTGNLEDIQAAADSVLAALKIN